MQDIREMSMQSVDTNEMIRREQDSLDERGSQQERQERRPLQRLASLKRPCGEDAPSGKKVCLLFFAYLGFLVALLITLISLAPNEPPRPDLGGKTKTYPTLAGEHAFAITIGIQRQTTIESTILVVITFLIVVGCTVPSALVATFNPELVPPDFEEKGTLSNVAQDTYSPHGRLFTVLLFTAGIMQTFSMYTFSLYYPWAPENPLQQNPWRHPVFVPESERVWRAVWVILPNVGIMFTAALPSLSDTEGYKLALAIVHNVCAPLAMLFATVMETYQLSYGEGAFHQFFTNDVEPPYTLISDVTRLRVIIVGYAWGTGFLFLGIQIYLGLGSALGVKIRTSYSLALASFYNEILSLMFIFYLPVCASMEMLNKADYHLSTMDDAAWLLHDAFNLTASPTATLEM